MSPDLATQLAVFLSIFNSQVPANSQCITDLNAIFFSSCLSQNHISYGCQSLSFIFCGCQPLNFVSRTCCPLSSSSCGYEPIGSIFNSFRALNYVSHGFQPVSFMHSSFQPACSDFVGWQSPFRRRTAELLFQCLAWQHFTEILSLGWRFALRLMDHCVYSSGAVLTCPVLCDQILRDCNCFFTRNFSNSKRF